MTPVDKDDFEDADLARRLAAMPQPEPSPELDAAIFAQIEKDLKQAPPAANDPATEAPRPGLLRRYRAPLAFAASLAGVAILLPVWRGMQQRQLVDVQIISEDAALPAAPPADAVIAAPGAPRQESKRESGVALEQSAKPAPAAGPMTLPAPALEPMLPPPPPRATPGLAPAPAAPPSHAASPAGATAAAPALAPPPTPAPAPVPAPAASAPAPAAASVRAPAAESVSAPAPAKATAVRAAVAESAAPPPPAPAASAPAPKADTRATVGGYRIPQREAKEWLQAIERMLDTGDTATAAAQWKRFRKAYPDFPVPDTLSERLNVLE